MRTILKRIISFLLTVLASAGLVRLPVSVPVPTPADAPEIVMDGETVYTYNTEYTGITYTVSPEGEAVVRSMYGTENSNHVVSIPPVLGGCPVTAVSIQRPNNTYAYIFNALIPESVRSFTITVGFHCDFHIYSLYCFSDAMTIDVPDGSVSRFICIAGTQTAENASSLPVETYAPEQYEQGCLFTGTVVDMIAPCAQRDFVVPETVGGRAVTGLHATALATRCDLDSVELPETCDLLDMGISYDEFPFPLPMIRCVLNSAANRRCYENMLPCVQLLPDGTEYTINYGLAAIYRTQQPYKDDATFLEWEIRDGEAYITDVHMGYYLMQPLYYLPKNFTVPEKILGYPVVSVGGLYVGDHSYKPISEIGVTTVTLPPTVRRIEAYAFEGQDKLTSINLNHVEFVGQGAFDDCDALTAFHFGKSLRKIDSFISVRGADYKQITLSFDPDCPLEEIGRWFLENDMERLEFPNHLKYIRDGAMDWSCAGTLVIPPSVQSIGLHGVWGGDVFMLSRDAELAKPEDDNIGLWSNTFCGWLGLSTSGTLYCYKDSTAHVFAEKYGIHYVLLDDSALLLDGAAQTQTIRIDNPTDRDTFLQSLSVQGGAALDLHSGDTVTTGATVTLTDPTYGHIERTFTVVCPGDLDADGMRDTNADEALLRQYNARLRTDDSAAFAAADVNGDGLVNTTDVTAMRVRRTE